MSGVGEDETLASSEIWGLFVSCITLLLLLSITVESWM